MIRWKKDEISDTNIIRFFYINIPELKHKFAFRHWNTLQIKDAAIGLYELVRGENLRIGNTTNVKDRLHLAVNCRT